MASRDHLRRAILDVLWDSQGPITAEQVREQLPRDLAPTTVLTVLDRLRHDGLVARRRYGRSYRHWPTATREDALARSMVETLHGAADERRLLGRFVDNVTGEEAQLIRAALSIRCACGPGCGCEENCACRGTEDPAACTAHDNTGRASRLGSDPLVNQAR